MLPGFKNGEVIFAFDVDSIRLNDFDKTDEQYLQQVVALIEKLICNAHPRELHTGKPIPIRRLSRDNVLYRVPTNRGLVDRRALALNQLPS